MPVSLTMRDDGWYDAVCRQGLGVVALLHWLAFGLMVWGASAPSRAPVESSVDAIGHFAITVVRALWPLG